MAFWGDFQPYWIRSMTTIITLKVVHIDYSIKESIISIEGPSSICTLMEAQWHKILGCTYGLQRWQIYIKNTKRIKYDNRIKFIAFQINRNTNTRIAKFAPNVIKSCTFCISPTIVQGINTMFHNVWIDRHFMKQNTNFHKVKVSILQVSSSYI